MINMFKIKNIIIIVIFSIILGRVIYLNVFMHEYYTEELYEKTNLYVYGTSAKRGRILDVNGNVLVDSIGVNTIFYNKQNNMTQQEEIDIAYQLSKILTMDIASVSDQKEFYLLLNNNGKDLITDEEYILYNERKLTDDEIKNLKLERIDLNKLSDMDKKAANIYYLMNSDYSYAKKNLKENVSDEEFAVIAESNIKGITTEIIWERYYPYKDTLSSILGSISQIYAEDKEYYLDKGYEMSDIVGVSYLEKEYEEYLKGEKAIYKVNENGTLKLIKEEIVGNDIYLSIDINIQLELEKIIKDELLKSQDMPNTEYFTDTYAAISNPLTGEILAISGQRILKNEKITSYDEITNEILTSSFTVGSVVKGATMAVGYNNDLIIPDKEIYDSCVKLYLVPEKCSWKDLGYIDDIDALIQSSNYYQYLLAIGLTGQNYTYNMKLNATEREFDIYRDTLKEYGLGDYTNIDLEGEINGYEGEIIADDLLMNLAIGQYDTYTLLQLLQYINTIANDKERLELSLLDKVYNNNELIYDKTNKVLNTLSINDEYFERIKEGLNGVVSGGTAYGYIDNLYDPVGKTGTSESFLDSNKDGEIDTKTTTLTFAGYAPLENPKYSIAIITPHIAHSIDDDNDYVYRISRYISKDITDFLFENY